MKQWRALMGGSWTGLQESQGESIQSWGATNLKAKWVSVSRGHPGDDREVVMYPVMYPTASMASRGHDPTGKWLEISWLQGSVSSWGDSCWVMCLKVWKARRLYVAEIWAIFKLIWCIMVWISCWFTGELPSISSLNILYTLPSLFSHSGTQMRLMSGIFILCHRLTFSVMLFYYLFRSAILINLPSSSLAFSSLVSIMLLSISSEF
jgi:hypothetical protein